MAEDTGKNSLRNHLIKLEQDLISRAENLDFTLPEIFYISTDNGTVEGHRHVAYGSSSIIKKSEECRHKQKQ